MSKIRKIHCPLCGGILTDINDLTEGEIKSIFGKAIGELPESRYFYCIKCNEFWLVSAMSVWRITKERILLDAKITDRSADILPADLMSDEEKEEYVRRVEEETRQFQLALLEDLERKARKKAKEVGGISHRCLKCGKLLTYIVEFQRGICIDCMRKMWKASHV